MNCADWQTERAALILENELLKTCLENRLAELRAAQNKIEEVRVTFFSQWDVADLRLLATTTHSDALRVVQLAGTLMRLADTFERKVKANNLSRTQAATLARQAKRKESKEAKE